MKTNTLKNLGKSNQAFPTPLPIYNHVKHCTRKFLKKKQVLFLNAVKIIWKLLKFQIANTNNSDWLKPSYHLLQKWVWSKDFINSELGNILWKYGISTQGTENVLSFFLCGTANIDIMLYKSQYIFAHICLWISTWKVTDILQHFIQKLSVTFYKIE